MSKRISSFLLSLLMLCHLLLPAVPIYADTGKDLPVSSGTSYIDDDFSDGVLDSRLEADSSAQYKVSEEDGKLRLKCDDASSTNKAYYYLKSDKTGVTGTIMTEITLTRNKDATTYFQLRGTSGIVAIINWWDDNANSLISLQYADEKDGGRKNHNVQKSTYNAENCLTVKLFWNTVTQEVDIWLNGIYAASGYSCGADNLSYLWLYTQTQVADNFADDLKVYPANYVKSDKDCCMEDADLLTKDSILKAPLGEEAYLTDSLSLPQTGANGSTITWISSKPDVISDTGWLVRPEDDADVTLTATISKGLEQTEKSFTFNVAGLMSGPDDTPSLTHLAYSDGFDDEAIDSSHIAVVAGGGAVNQSGGTINIVRQGADTANPTQVNVYPEDNKASYNGNLFVEFLMTRKNQGTLQAQLRGSSGICAIVGWYPVSDTYISLQYADEKGGSRKAHRFLISDYGALDSLKVSVYYSPSEGTISFWLNNKFAASGYSAGAENLQRVWFLAESSDLNASVDDVRYYYAIEEDSVAVEKDIANLKNYFTPGELTEGTLYKSVSLPQKGIYGSVIEWETSNSSLLNTDGTLTRPNEESYPDGDPEITITATVTKGESSAEKNLTYKVLRRGIGDKQTVQLDYDYLTLESLLEKEEQFEGYISQNLILPSKGKNGSTITWYSSHTGIVQLDGTVNRPETAVSNPEITLTALLNFEGETLEKTFKFYVMPVERDNMSKIIPSFFETIYEDDFSAGSPKAGYWTLRPWATGTAAVNRDNKLQLTRKNASEDMTYARLKVDPIKDKVYDNIAVSFTLEKSGSGDGKVQLLYSSGGIISTVNWQANNKFSVTYADSFGGSARSVESASAHTSEVEITALLNTKRKVFSLWIDNNLVVDEKYPARSMTDYGLYGLRMDLEGDNLISMFMDNVHIYYSMPYPYDAVFYDADKITGESLLTKDYVMPNTIDSNLILPQVGYYGSDVSWESSDPSIISADGVVTRPVNAAENPKVTLTATITKNGYITTKAIDYYVMTGYTGDEGYVDADISYLSFENYNAFSQNDSSQYEIYSSLRLPTKLAYGSSVMWTSSDESAITSSGRVIRRRYDEGTKSVILTASVTYGDCTKTKDFECVVIPDEELKDPGYMSDEEFFGVWENGTWKTKGKFDYASNPGMASVEEAAKAGNYQAAKEVLLAYMKARPKADIYGEQAVRNTKEVELALFNGVWGYITPYNLGSFKVADHSWHKTEISLDTSMISNNKKTMVIQSAYNENSSISIASRKHENSSYHPYMEVVVNGKKYTFKAEADTVIRGGDYAKINHYGQTEYTCKMFDEFTGDENYNPIFRFDLTSLPEEAVIEDAKLFLTVKINEQNAKTKDILIIQDADVTWEEEAISWSTFTREWYCAEGIDGRMNWLGYPLYNESEYHQTHRFPIWPAAAAEYSYTKDERYAYEMIYTMMDYIIDSQFEMSLYDLWYKYNPGGYFWVEYVEYDEEQGDTEFKNTKRRGSLPHLMSSTFRIDRWISSLDILLESKYMTADVCTTILKNVWDVCHEGTKYLEAYALEKAKTSANNFWTYEGVKISKAAIYMPEFDGCTDWIRLTVDIFQNMSEGGFYSDGSYQEASDGYSGSVIRNYYSLFLLLEKAGLSHLIPESFTDFMYDATIYNELLIRDAYGIAMSWGDSGWSRKFGRMFEEYEEINPDDEYLFLDTLGKEGTQPQWTSKHYSGNLTAFMRSDWTRNALHLFTNCNGTGGHGHQDNNAIRLSAYGDYLLTDPGYMTYEASEYRTWGTSTEAHNTVEVDGYTQKTVGVGQPILGYLNEWSTNNQFDVLSQTSTAYNYEDLNADVEHRRTITFLKSGFWIVSDLMLPSDDVTEHSYKQLWHMLPEYGKTMTINQEEGTVSSNVSETNLIISSPDGNPIVRDDTGWYMVRWGSYEPAPFTYYHIENAKGNTGFNTVLLPYPNKNQGDLKTEKIDLGSDVKLDEATAMKITSTVDGQTSVTSYMLEYEPTPGTLRSFGEYSGDGMVNAIRVDSDGKIAELILNKGTTLKKGDKTILETGSETPVNIGLEIRGTTAIISSNDCVLNPEELAFAVDTKLENVILNDKYVEFYVSDGMLYLTSNEADENLKDDSSADKGGVSAPSSPGGSGGGGASSGASGGTVAPGITPGSSVSFSDTENHWAKNEINKIAELGIINGYNGLFNPDNPITRAEIVTMASRMLNLPENIISTTFADVSRDSWYAPYVGASLEAGIISADTNFRPNDYVTREEMSKILVLLAEKYLEKDHSVPSDYQMNFSDNSSIADWAQPYVKSAHFHGYINGMSDGSFAPGQNATRAQIAVVLSRIITSK